MHKEEAALSETDQQDLTIKIRQLVRYLTSSHRTGAGQCADGEQWGLNWQSSWWASKLALGAHQVRHLLEPDDYTAIERLVLAEADRQMRRLIPSGLAEDTKAEETAWDAEILAVALLLLPQSEHRDRWKSRIVEFSINTFSRPSDRNSMIVLDGITVGEACRSCNIHEDGSLENHGANHFCYVASPLLSKSWCSLALSMSSIPVPEALAHNVEYVWRFAEPTFLTNRFAYLAGQDWARYTYGEYFILPALCFLASIGCGSKTGTIFNQRLQMIEMEARRSSDGSFFGARFTEGLYNGQFAKYETDCFACVALSLAQIAWQKLPVPSSARETLPSVVISYESQCCYARSSTSFMSFAWSTLTRSVPNLNFISFADDSLCEWHEANLLGSVKFVRPVKWVGVKAMDVSEGALRVEGSHSMRYSSGFSVADHDVSLCLSDGCLRVSSIYTARSERFVAHTTGLNWRVPNDVFNAFQRRYFWGMNNYAISSWESDARKQVPSQNPISTWSKLKRRMQLYGEVVELGSSSWVNIDNRIGLVFPREQSIFVRRFPRKEAPWGSLNVEQVEVGRSRWQIGSQPGKIILETNYVAHVGTAEQTLELSRKWGFD